MILILRYKNNIMKIKRKNKLKNDVYKILFKC